jgi:hypothetical protein
MRVESSLALCGLLLGCAVNIGQNDGAPPKPSPDAPALHGCLPLADRAAAVTGRVSRLSLPDQSSLVLADSASVDGVASSVGFANAQPDCLSASTPLSARPIIDVSALGLSSVARPLAAVSGSETFLYFSAQHGDGFASDGIGVARWDAENQRFAALALLWTADRPSYGSAAALVGDQVYALGGLPARFLSADIYLARVPLAAIAEPSAYEYWQGGGNFGADADRAVPLVDGGRAPTLAFNAARQRFILLYATPFAKEVTVRSGLSVSGPWSAPYALGQCDLPSSDPSAFCGDLTLLADLSSDTEIVFTQGVASFSRPAGSTDQDFWTRFVRAPWPENLP